MENLEVIVKLLIAVLIGGIIGAEREYHNKSAGLRTLMLICLGSTLFTMFSMEIGKEASPDRIAGGIVAGIGFVGAGVIFRGGAGINGVTTAATIWVTAALGMGVGAGHQYAALMGCIILVGILYAFTVIETWIDRINRSHTYKITCAYREKVFEHYEALMKQHRLKFIRGPQCRDNQTVSGTWEAEGSKKSHDAFIHLMLADVGVQKFEF
ncbi:MgtC/SapB family protein [Niastella caeni]|uniref:MgtC/SapB family protein n=1 Tax=Niastella caeni TaxID=2569763 RepID=A0A4S8HZ77_9BACT|nr:MgtC/SapB family protein [Niastella caeni]THU39474.1 MgtC/SapB family protein [Niastella caeni]